MTADAYEYRVLGPGGRLVLCPGPPLTRETAQGEAKLLLGRYRAGAEAVVERRAVLGGEPGPWKVWRRYLVMGDGGVARAR